ncbi:molybdopterin-dependent oxidoreductase [Neorhizobium galegae]|uniref:molybdopterin-dependent oxidoreductase n=1 Tax=Neorhizobium galegae TaxID=399 RepID=UPI002106D5E2|nr:molybdopterin-dependent oxidoreductase [Neorhizobium galegae]MCQ1774352.1 molybdopterin-dependent oxidoreductase [Neorhizobium galegae]MCQ1799531.1 molybdopterin-dependent oxidoreductase [Neorhizobium galegae]
MERHPGYCTLCRSRCGSYTLVENGRMVGVEPRLDHPTGGALCAKGRAAPEMVHSPRRLTVPLRRANDRMNRVAEWKEISWDEALDEIAEKLLSVRGQSGAEAVAFALTTPSGTPIVDSYEWVERFIRVFGSPNLIYAIEVCGWHKDYAHALTFGRGLGVPEYDKADVIVLWGHNPARTWLAQAGRVADAKARGAKVVVIDPKPDGSGQQSDVWLRVLPGTDGALAMGAIRHLLQSGRYNDPFVRHWTNAGLLIDTSTRRFVTAGELAPSQIKGDFQPSDWVVAGADGRVIAWDTRRALPSASEVALQVELVLEDRDGKKRQVSSALSLLHQRAAGFTPERVGQITGVPEPEQAAFYALLENAPKLAYYSWTGVGQHTNATMTERAISSLMALIGSCDGEGGNIWTVAPPWRPLSDYSLLPDIQKAKALGLAELPLGPPAHGWINARDFARAVLEKQPYQVRALMSFGTNFAVSQIDTPRNLAALRALEFHVHADMYMNPTAECADIVLPVNMPWERDALRPGFEITQEAAETVQLRRRMLEPAGGSRADYDIVMSLAKRMGMADAFFGGDVESGWNWQLEPLSVTVDDLRHRPDGMRFPQPFSYRKFAAANTEGEVSGFNTPTRRVELYSQQLLDHGFDPLADFVPTADSPGSGNGLPLVLTTAKSGWFVHTSHRHIASLRRKSPEPSVEISGELARTRGLIEGEWAEVRTSHGVARLRARINDRLDPRTVIAEFGWWEACEPLGRDGGPAEGNGTVNINAILSDEARDPISGSVPLRAVACEISRSTSGNDGFWNGKRRFRVTEMRGEGLNTVALFLSPCDGGKVPDFLAGQHVVFEIPGTAATRAYSLTASPVSASMLSVAVRWDGSRGNPPISLSREIHGLNVGDEVLLSPPGGNFTMPLRSSRPILMLANGIGITPFVSYLEGLAKLGEEVTHPVWLMHGCRNGREHPFAGHVAGLASLIPTLRRIIAYSAPTEEDQWKAQFQQTGRLDLSPLQELAAERPLAYICGSPGFNSAMIARLVEMGIPRFDIFAESFSSATSVPPKLEPQTVTIAGSDRSFSWDASQGSILDAALAAGVALPSGCRVGQCESCAVRVVEGQVAHLVETDLEDGQCLTCQAVPLSALKIII